MYQQILTYIGKPNQIALASHCNDKKENQIFLIHKEIQSGAVATQSNMPCLTLH
jgi:hypothetical protein